MARQFALPTRSGSSPTAPGTPRPTSPRGASVHHASEYESSSPPSACSVIIDDLDRLSSIISPSEAHSIALVDANRVVIPPIALQRLESVPGWSCEVTQLLGCVQLVQFALGHAPQRLRAARPRCLGVSAVEDILCAGVLERMNHRLPPSLPGLVHYTV